MARPRFHHQWSPDELWIEKTFDADVLKRLTGLGHKLDVEPPVGAANAIVFRNGEFIGVSEPRSNGKAAGD